MHFTRATLPKIRPLETLNFPLQQRGHPQSPFGSETLRVGGKIRAKFVIAPEGKRIYTNGPLPVSV
jgi:hypothetical protein